MKSAFQANAVGCASEAYHFATHRVLDYPEYRFEIDEYRFEYRPHFVAHFRVSKWSPSVLKRILFEWKVFRSVVPFPLYASGEDDDRKWRRFVTLLGFVPHTSVLCNDGQHRSIYISYKV